MITLTSTINGNILLMITLLLFSFMSLKIGLSSDKAYKLLISMGGLFLIGFTLVLRAFIFNDVNLLSITYDMTNVLTGTFFIIGLGLVYIGYYEYSHYITGK